MGSASLFFALLPKEAILADLNADVVNVHRALKADAELLHRTVSALPADPETYYKLRDEFNGSADASRRATLFLYLNRHCFNGVYRTNRAGDFNTPVGRRTGALPSIERFLRSSKALETAQIEQRDFRDTLYLAAEGDFVYMDPPYLSARPTYGEYGYGSFDPRGDLADFLDLVSALNKRGVRMTISYNDHPDLRRVIGDWNVATLTSPRRVAGQGAARREGAPEVIACNFEAAL